VIDVSSASGRDPGEDLEIVRRELELFDPSLLDRPQIVVANKIDALDDASRLTALETRAAALSIPVHATSAVTGEGVASLLEAVWLRLAARRGAEAEEVSLERFDQIPADDRRTKEPGQ
jgi:GTPase